MRDDVKACIAVIILMIILNVVAWRKVSQYKMVIAQQEPMLTELNDKVQLFYDDYVDLFNKINAKYGGKNELRRVIPPNTDPLEQK